MPRLSIHFSADPAPAALFALAGQALAGGARALAILAADGNDCRAEDFDDWLRRLDVPVCGGVFPQLIHERRNQPLGYLVIGFSTALTVVDLPGLSDPDADYYESVEALFDGTEPPHSLLVLVDGMASRIGALLDGIYDVLGSEPGYFGGGAGSLSFVRKPCLFSNQGMLTDHAQLVSLPWPLDLAVEHGWQRFAGPFVVTAAQGNIVTHLDFKPAFEVYRQHVEADSGQRFDSGNFFSIAKAYPFGMERPDGSLVVRDPITRADNGVTCVGEVPANSVVHLLRGQPEALIDAAARCGKQLAAGNDAVMVVDCISRVLFLQDAFTRELEAVQQAVGARPLFGMLTLGEIANGGSTCLEFYNKTLVLASPRA